MRGKIRLLLLVTTILAHPACSPLRLYMTDSIPPKGKFIANQLIIRCIALPIAVLALAPRFYPQLDPPLPIYKKAIRYVPLATLKIEKQKKEKLSVCVLTFFTFKQRPRIKEKTAR